MLYISRLLYNKLKLIDYNSPCIELDDNHTANELKLDDSISSTKTDDSKHSSLSFGSSKSHKTEYNYPMEIFSTKNKLELQRQILMIQVENHR